MVKKIFAAIIAIFIAFSPAGNIILQDHQQIEVSAKKYRSGTKRYNNNRSNFQNRQNDTVNRGTARNTTPTPFNNRGGLMRGMLYGGLAGLFLGGFLSHMGSFAPIMGLGINLIGIIIVIMLIFRIFSFRRNRYGGDGDKWRR